MSALLQFLVVIGLCGVALWIMESLLRSSGLGFLSRGFRRLIGRFVSAGQRAASALATAVFRRRPQRIRKLPSRTTMRILR